MAQVDRIRMGSTPFRHQRKDQWVTWNIFSHAGLCSTPSDNKVQGEYEMKLETMATVIGGIATKKSDLEKNAGTMFSVVQVKHVQDGAIADASDLKEVYLGPNRKPEGHLILKGDILVSVLGAKVKVAVIDKPPKNSLAGKGLAIIRPGSKSKQKHISEYLLSEDGMEKLRSLRTGAAMPFTRITDLKDIDIP
jgi:type I restriction enzyme M protein